MVAAPLPLIVPVAEYVRRKLRNTAVLPSGVESGSRPMFAEVSVAQSAHSGWVAFSAAVLGQAVIIASLAQAYVWAQFLLVLVVTLLIADSEGRSTLSFVNGQRLRLANVSACVILTSFALTPFLRENLQSLGLRSLVSVGSRVPTAARVPGTSFTGFILTTRPAQKRDHVESPKNRSAGTGSLQKERVIPFDGVYWYYEKDLSRPGPDAPVQKGDPLIKTIRSNSFIPLAMEAHQHLGWHISGDCCGGLAVDLRDADNRVGSIAVEALLSDTSAPGHPSYSLGSKMILASVAKKISLYRAPVDERLHFSMHNLPRPFRFDDITLRIIPAHGREFAGARIKIKVFVLEP